MWSVCVWAYNRHLLHMEYAVEWSVCFSGPPKGKDLVFHPYIETKFLKKTENHIFIRKDWVEWYFRNNFSHLNLRPWKNSHPWFLSILWPRAQSISIRLRTGYNFVYFKLLLLRILFFRDKLTSVDGHVGLNNSSPFLEWSISVALLSFKDGLVLTDTVSANVSRMLIFPLCGSASPVSHLFGENILNLYSMKPFAKERLSKDVYFILYSCSY